MPETNQLVKIKSELNGDIKSCVLLKINTD